jgi:sulfate transport system permease protein
VWVQALLIGVAIVFVLFSLVFPVGAVFWWALRDGPVRYLQALISHDSLSAIGLTLLTTTIVVPLNTVFGLATAWLITKHQFWGKSLLITIVDLPFSVSPVVAGLLFVLLCGRNGLLGPLLQWAQIPIIFATPGVVIATAFVTLPFVAREVLTQMQSQGSDAEQAALTLGATGWQTFVFVTIPKIRWSLLYGVVLCSARAMGEFGAVSVVSGHVRGQTDTIPLAIEILYNDYDFTGAFALASLLTLFALVTLVFKKMVEAKA